ncbi:MAG: T9SS type A sorting domain-containing protein [Bacteroidia bacterium]|nr:T9SS type A sorting domain-containing protein [Bacteroidia bacterium]
MKKVLLSCLSLCSFAAFSQVTLVQWDLANIGFAIRQAHDTMPVVTPGPSGASQTWNFTNLNSHTVDTLTFTNPNWLPNSSSFPTSNLAVIFGSSGMYAFARNTSSDFKILGQYGDFGLGPMIIDMNPDEQIMSWPSTFNTTFNNTSGMDVRMPFPNPPMDSARLQSVKVKTSLVDGWGTVTTPLVANLPCLRVREMNITYDTISIHLSFPPVWQVFQTNIDTSYNYSWWTPNTNNAYGFPVVEISTDSAGNVTDASWLQAAPTQSGISEQELTPIPNYPNPASQSITFLTKGLDVKTIRIMDVSGNLIREIQVQGSQVSLNVESFAAGTYFYVAVDGSNTMKKAGKFSIVK